METLTQEGAILRRAKVAQALAGSCFVEGMHICRFQPEGWKIAVCIKPGDEALKLTLAHLAELHDSVNIYNPQLVEDPQFEALFKKSAP